MPGDGSLGAASHLFWQQSTQPGCVSFYLCKHQKGSLPVHQEVSPFHLGAIRVRLGQCASAPSNRARSRFSAATTSVFRLVLPAEFVSLYLCNPQKGSLPAIQYERYLPSHSTSAQTAGGLKPCSAHSQKGIGGEMASFIKQPL